MNKTSFFKLKKIHWSCLEHKLCSLDRHLSVSETLEKQINLCRWHLPRSNPGGLLLCAAKKNKKCGRGIKTNWCTLHLHIDWELHQASLMSRQKADFEEEIGDYDEVAIKNYVLIFKSRSKYIIYYNVLLSYLQLGLFFADVYEVNTLMHIFIVIHLKSGTPYWEIIYIKKTVQKVGGRRWNFFSYYFPLF